MGGFGSGRQFHWSSKATVDDYLSLDVRRLHRKGVLSSGREIPWKWKDSEGDPKGRITIQGFPDSVHLAYRLNEEGESPESFNYGVALHWTNCHYGGRRPWFLCPAKGCGNRVAKLYLGRRYFFCRRCRNLTYPSQQENREGRLRYKAQKIRLKLGGSVDLFEPFPQKPKGMHWRTYWVLYEKGESADYESLDLIVKLFSKGRK